MLKYVRVALNERVVVSKRGLPYRALGPGAHWVWGIGLEVFRRFDTGRILFETPKEVRAVLPQDWFEEARIGSDERGVLWHDGRPVRFLRPGVHRFWTVDPDLKLVRYSVDEAMPELSDELYEILPLGEYVDVTVQAHQVGLRFVDGKLVDTVEPGRYTLWSHPAAQVTIECVDMRSQDLALTGQELMTRDKVTLRLTLMVQYAISDAARAATAVADVRDAIYLMVQLAARAFVAGVSLDELLEGREAMTAYLEQQTVSKAQAIGVRIDRVGVKDVVLPGEMKTLLNRVIEAEKEAAANVILRREETAATRSLANTARMMAEQPALMRLKELESLKEIAGQIGEIRLVVGSDGLDKLLPAALVGGSSGCS